MTKSTVRYLMKARLNLKQRAYVEKIREIVGGSRVKDKELILMAMDFFGKALAQEIKQQQEAQEAAKHKEILELKDEKEAATTEQDTEGNGSDVADREEVQDDNT